MRETRPIGSRPPALATALLSMVLPLADAPAIAQEAPTEPLFLRIRPQAPDPGLGAGGQGDAHGDARAVATDAEVARRARAAREAVWARSQRNADRLIASVCTGCLKDWPARRTAPPEAPAAANPARAVPDPQPTAPESPRAPATAVAALDPVVPDPKFPDPKFPGPEFPDPGSGTPAPETPDNPGAEATP